MTGKIARSLFFCVALTLFVYGSGQECTTTGRFSIYGTDCKYYIHCTLSGGVYYSTTNYCPGVSYFNPRSQECVDSYICGDTFCEEALDSSTTSATFAEFLDPNLSDGVSYIRCVRYNDTAVLPIYLTCSVTFTVTNTSTNEGCCPYVSCETTTDASATTIIATGSSTTTATTITAATAGTTITAVTADTTPTATTTAVTAGTISTAATTAVTADTTSTVIATTAETSITATTTTVTTVSPTTATTVITAVT